jgi:transketolase
VDGHDAAQVSRTIAQARECTDRPTLIVCKTHIGKGSPNRVNTAKAHGEPLGADEIKLTREAIGWHHAPFVIPKEVYADWDAKARGKALEADWNARFAAYKAAHPALAKELLRRVKGELPKHFVQTAVDTVIGAHRKAETVASRKASQLALESFTAALPELLGGSADLTGSNLTNTKSTPHVRFATDGDVVQTADANGTLLGGRHINYGVREFGMAAIMNGVALHGGFVPFGGTFLVFSDYARNAVRMSALMGLPVINVYTHDSIGLGEDGPTHQPVEHTASLRLIPNHDVWRPCDAAETHVAWLSAATRRDRPTSLILTRQALPGQARDAEQVAAMARGGYVLKDAEGAQAVLIATGSEVALAVEAQTQLAARGIAVRVVSMPCTQVFEAQPAAWRESVLPKGLPRVAVEAGVTDGWYRYVGHDGAVVGLNRFGASAPAKVLFEQFGFTPAQVAATVEGVLAHR